MRIDVELEGGMLPDRYGKYASAQDTRGAHGSLRSFPFTVEGIPQGTRALAWLFYDWDSIPVCGMQWMHWCAWYGAGEQGVPTVLEVPEDASRSGMPGLRQGRNSNKAPGGFRTGYAGPCPPDRDHVYTLHVVALDEEPHGLGEPFWANELIAACRGHVLDGAKVDLPSRS
jgi:Raf kinase inhibitor-like YbhB/YbcL family protein